MPLITTATLRLDADQTVAQDLGTVDLPVTIARTIALANGTGAGQADKIFHDRRNLAPSTGESLDLAGVLLDPITQATLTFVRIKGLYVASLLTNANDISVGANIANGWATLIGPTGASGGTVTLKPGAAFMAFTSDATAWPVTAGTGDLLRVINLAGGTSVDYDIVVIGASA